jgi:hypothetical protein
MTYVNPFSGEYTYEMFRHDLAICQRKRPKHIREGQEAFNRLRDVKPDLARALTATDADPFYNDSRLEAFFDHIEEHWDDA